MRSVILTKSWRCWEDGTSRPCQNSRYHTSLTGCKELGTRKMWSNSLTNFATYTRVLRYWTIFSLFQLIWWNSKSKIKQERKQLFRTEDLNTSTLPLALKETSMMITVTSAIQALSLLMAKNPRTSLSSSLWIQRTVLLNRTFKLNLREA